MLKNIFNLIKKIFTIEQKEEEQQKLDKIMEVSMSKNMNNNTENYFVLDYNSLSIPQYNSKTNYSDFLNTTIASSKDNSLQDGGGEEENDKLVELLSDEQEMSSLDITNTLSEWNTIMDLSKTML